MQALKPRVPRISLRVVREAAPRDYQPVHITTPDDAVQFLAYLADKAEEHFVALHLNARHEVIALVEISHGTLSSSLVHPREVFKSALVNNAYAVLVAHNHPSGAKLEPSREDIETTEQLVAAGKVLGVNLVDHVIIGGHSSRAMQSYSLREHKPELWGV